MTALLLAAGRAAPPARGQASPPSPETVTAKRVLELNWKCFGLTEEGRYDTALELGEQAYRLASEKLGPSHQTVAQVGINLGRLYQVKGDYARSEQYLRQSVSILEKLYGPIHAMLAAPLNNLGTLYATKGDYARAEQAFRRAVGITETVMGPEHWRVGIMLRNVGNWYMEQRRLGEAESYFRRALAIAEKAEGPESASAARSLAQLAYLLREKGETAEAEQTYGRALAAWEKAGGAEHSDAAAAVFGLGVLYEARGDARRAALMYRRSLAITEKSLGPLHPDAAAALDGLALLYAAEGDLAQALRYKARALEISEHNIALVLNSGSEEQKRLFMRTLAGETDTTITLHLDFAPRDAEAARLALTTILRRKGRALDVMNDQIAALRRRSNAEDRALLEQLSAVRARHAALVLKGPGESSPAGYKEELEKLGSEADRLEAAVSERSAEFRAQSRPVTLELVQRATPADAALIEITSYRPYGAKARTYEERWRPARYAAYVTTNGGELRWVDLGPAAPVDLKVAQLRRALSNPLSRDVREAARAVDEAVMRPIRGLTGVAKKFFISPDGALNLIPFGALVDEGGKYLVENYSITYLTSGRDLLRLRDGGERLRESVIVADPLFDLAGADAAKAGGAVAARGTRSADFEGVSFGQLPGTAGEARHLAAMMPDATLLTRGRATESSLKQLSRPRLLHIATHGFFLPERAEPAAGGAASNAPAAREASPPRRPSQENPLLRSGLALSGANQKQDGAGEDGILTAYEAAGLDLWGTKLVVLSACETGIGEVRNGEGVYGLRRALVLAGSESQVMSLWQVSDDATRDLMVAYYKRLMAGEGRTEALRRVQIEMLTAGAAAAPRGGARSQRGLAGNAAGAARDRSHPFYWASFIQSGEWEGLDARPPSR